MIPSSPSLSPLQIKLRDKLAAARAASAVTATISSPEPKSMDGTDKFGHSISYNHAQTAAITAIGAGQSCVLIGAAGTGKTTTQKAATQALIDNGHLVQLNSKHRYLPSSSLGIAICAFTRRATNNIRKNINPALGDNCITIHKLLEYEPVEHYVTQEDGTQKRSMRFEPARNALNPLPSNLSTIIIEEASMVSTHLFQEIMDACPHKPQFVFIGDIQQLPPVFGSAILGYKMLELDVIELTEVYRQALESPILSLAHRILSGKPIHKQELSTLNVPGKLTLHPWKKQISADSATSTLAAFFIKALDEHKYNPETDGILIPFNKACGTDELNKHIATRIAQRNQQEVYEIIHGFKKSYYSVGDKCLYEKEDAIILSIAPNPLYTGATPQPPSVNLNYWGHSKDHATSDDEGEDNLDIDFILANVAMGTNDENAVRQASHTIKIQLLDSEREVTLKSAGEVDALILGYAITVHKSQGSEWEKVFLCLHKSHNQMLQRELLYTAVTRAKSELFCICEPDAFQKGIERQRIKGSTWEEKAEWFKGKIMEGINQS